MLLAVWRSVADWLLLVVVEALQSSHAKASAEVLQYGLWAIKNLAARNAALRAQLGELGACEGNTTT